MTSRTSKDNFWPSGPKVWSSSPLRFPTDFSPIGPKLMGHHWSPISVRLLTSVPVGQKLWMCLPNRKIVAHWTTISNSLFHSQPTSSPMATKLSIKIRLLLPAYFRPSGSEVFISEKSSVLSRNSVPLWQNYYPSNFSPTGREVTLTKSKKCATLLHIFYHPLTLSPLETKLPTALTSSPMGMKFGGR